MQIRFHCPTEKCVAIIELEPLETAGESIRCPRCKEAHRIMLDDSILGGHGVEICPVCRCRELFIRKDFPQKTGVFVVLAAALLSLWLLQTNPIHAYGVLVSAVLVDLAIFTLVGKVTICYACRAEFRGATLNSQHDDFNLATSEKY